MATKRWIGGAAARVDVWTITVAGTWASADTVTISIGNKDLVITLGASASTLVADIAAEIADAFNASDNSTPGTGFTWSHGGQQFPEFQDLTATVLGAVVTLTGATAGLPHGLVVAEVTAGDGTATESNSVPATGPNFLDNADNYLDGVLPVDNDDLYFDTGAVSALYGLTHFRDNNKDLNYYITGDWTGALGLPALRTSPHSYAEYRQRYFQVRGGSKVLQVLPGVLGSTNQGTLYLDLQDQNTCSVTIESGRGTTTATPSIYLCGTTTASQMADMSIRAGCVSIEPDDAPTDAAKYFIPAVLTIGTPGSSLGDCIVYIGKNADLHLGDTIIVDGGTVHLYAATKVAGDTCDVSVTSGALFLASGGDEAIITVANGAAVYPTGPAGNIANMFCRGTLDYRRGGAKGVTSLKLYAGASLYNPSLNGPLYEVNLVGCTIQQLQAFIIPADRQIDWLDAAVPT